LEEARVIALIRAGEADAFAEIIEHYQASIIRYLYRLTGDYEMAKDLAQDTFIQQRLAAPPPEEAAVFHSFHFKRTRYS